MCVYSFDLGYPISTFFEKINAGVNFEVLQGNSSNFDAKIVRYLDGHGESDQFGVAATIASNKNSKQKLH